MSTGDYPESSSQRILAGIISVGRLGAGRRAAQEHHPAALPSFSGLPQLQRESVKFPAAQTYVRREMKRANGVLAYIYIYIYIYIYVCTYIYIYMYI